MEFCKSEGYACFLKHKKSIKHNNALLILNDNSTYQKTKIVMGDLTDKNSEFFNFRSQLMSGVIQWETSHRSVKLQQGLILFHRFLLCCHINQGKHLPGRFTARYKKFLFLVGYMGMTLFRITLTT